MIYPKMSIVTPSYNQARFLEETITSILDQNYPNLEYIIIDGGSSDGSVEIIKKYEKHLAYWVSEPDRGHGNALNKGFARATGEIMAWLNSDDKYFPGALCDIAEIFETFNDINWITGKTCQWDENGELSYEAYVYKNVYDFLIGHYQWIQQESTFWRRGLWEKAGGYINEQYQLMVDGELWTRFFRFDDLWHVNRKLGGYRFHATNRARLFPKEVVADMEKAIWDMKDHIRECQAVYERCREATSLSVFTDNDLSFLDYGVIDFVNHAWIKKRINYFTVKLSEENGLLIKYIRQKLGEVTRDSLGQTEYHSLSDLYKEWMGCWMLRDRGISGVLHRLGVRRAAVFGTQTIAMYLWRDLTREKIAVIRFVDNDRKKQGRQIHDIEVVAPEWFTENRQDIDALILSIEGEHDEKVKEDLRRLMGDDFPIMSWKDLVIMNRNAAAAASEAPGENGKMRRDG
jgi:glycosyltransferase involved in cell wall biosynthesis